MLHCASLYHLILYSGLKHSRVVITEMACALTGTNLLQMTCTDHPHHNEPVHLTGQRCPHHRAQMRKIINYACDVHRLHETGQCLYNSLLVE